MTIESQPPRARRASGPAAARRHGGPPARPDHGAAPRRPGPGRAPAVARAAAALAALLLLPACGDAGARLSLVGRDGVERRATVDRPAARAPAAGPRPLVVVLHAGLLSGASTRGELEPLPAMAREAGVALAFPDAQSLFWNDGSLSRALPRALSPAGDDLGFLDALVAALVADGTADPASIHIAGVSNGGMMALRYACARADRLASVAVFLATMPPGAEKDCRPARPLPVLVVAGTDDPVVRWAGEVSTPGGVAVLQRRMSVPETFAFWRRANGCSGLSPARALPRRGRGSEPDVLVHAAAGCAGGARTLLYEVRGGGHRLSAGDDWTLLRLLGRASPDIDPGALLLEFVLDPGGVPGLGQGARRSTADLQR